MALFEADVASLAALFFALNPLTTFYPVSVRNDSRVSQSSCGEHRRSVGNDLLKMYSLRDVLKPVLSQNIHARATGTIQTHLEVTYISQCILPSIAPAYRAETNPDFIESES